LKYQDFEIRALLISFFKAKRINGILKDVFMPEKYQVALHTQ